MTLQACFTKFPNASISNPIEGLLIKLILNASEEKLGIENVFGGNVVLQLANQHHYY